MKNRFWVLFLLLCLLQISCTGSGAVNPLSPANATKQDPSDTADSDVLYWQSFPVTFTLTDALNGVCLVSKKLGFACGNNGVVLKWDGQTWAKVDTGFAKNENLLSVAFYDESNGWFVGSHGTVIVYNNGNWSQQNAQTEETLYSVAVTKSRVVWVTGSNGTLLTYNGLSWGKIAATAATSGTGDAAATITDDIYGLDFSDPNNGWAVGNRGLILKYDGQTWKQYAGTPSTERLNSVSVVNDTQAWAVGAFGTILSFNGTTWNKMGSAFSGFDLYQVAMRNDSDGWAVGQDDTIIYYDGSRWISHPKMETKPSMNAVAFYKDLGFAVGQNGTILKFDPNGEPAKMSFLFKGEVSKKPFKSKPFWSITYTLMNQSQKASPDMVFALPIPRGFEPYVSHETPTPTPAVTAQVPITTPTPSAPSIIGTQTPVASKIFHEPSSVTGIWKVKDNTLQWDLGPMAPSEIKTLSVPLERSLKEKPIYPVVLRAVLNANDRLMAEAVPVTLLEAPAATPMPGAKSTPSSGGDENLDEGEPSHAATPAPGH